MKPTGRSERPQLTLRWTLPRDDGGCALQQFVIEARESSHWPFRQVTRCRADAGCELTLYCNQLPVDGNYLFRVSSVNELGVGPPLQTSFVQTHIGTVLRVLSSGTRCFI